MTLRLVLFLTRNSSLATWDGVGILDREIALYRRLAAMGASVSVVSYGGASERAYRSRVAPVRILCNRWALPSSLYERGLPIVHGAALWRAQVIKSNQTEGADIALRAATVWHRPMIARSGYSAYDFAVRRDGAESPGAARAKALEAGVFPLSARLVVTTDAMAADIADRIPACAPRTRVIPNYVDTAQFCPNEENERDIDVLFVGRLDAQKNVGAFLDALSQTSYKAVVVGSGPMEGGLKQQYGSLDGRLDFIGRVEHRDLPALFNRARLFVLPSHYEGHPKTLIEAMACGCAVLGADVAGIREQVVHDETGWLAANDAGSLALAFDHLLARPEVLARLGRAARGHAERFFSLDAVARQEFNLLTEVAAEGWRRQAD